MPAIAATGKALRIQLCSVAVKPRLGRYPKINGYHAPQMKNSSTIIRNSFERTDSFINLKLKTQNLKPITDRFLRFVAHMTQNDKPNLADRTFRFACDVVTFSRELSAESGVVRNIAWQLADAGTSVAANYEEAKASYSCREFAVKHCIVLKEARESRLWLRVIITCRLGTNEREATRLHQEF